MPTAAGQIAPRTTVTLVTFINLCRWLAAFFVVISHVRHLMLLELAEVPSTGLLTKALYFFTGFGHEAVVVFFVISGYLVGGLTLERWQTSGVDLRDYLAARVSRIHTVLLPALILGTLLDLCGEHWVNDAGLYTQAERYHTISMAWSPSHALTIASFFGNLLSLQGIFVMSHGSNYPLWSLAYEWWYYTLFALLAAGCLVHARARAAAFILAFLVACMLPAKLLLWGLIWLLGLLTRVGLARMRWRPPALLALAALGIALVVSRLSHNQTNVDAQEPVSIEFLRDLLVASCYAAALAAMAGTARGIVWPRVQSYLADFSYSVYLMHFPVMLLIVATMRQYWGTGIRMMPGGDAWALQALALVGIYAVCWAFSRITEVHTSQIRAALASLPSAAWLRRARVGPTS